MAKRKVEQFDTVPEEMPVTNVSIRDLDELCHELRDAETEKSRLEELVKTQNILIGKLSARIVMHMKEHKRSKYASPYGSGEIKEQWSVTNPKSDQEKALLFAHLTERGIFNKYATVNNKSLNALWKLDRAAAIAKGEGMEFAMPGVGAPNLFESFELKNPRKKKEIIDEPE